MEKIVKVLKEVKGVSSYRIINTKSESCELFYVLDKLETSRATNIDETNVTVYVNKSGMKGSSQVTIYKYMDENDIREKIEGAVVAARLALNPNYKLPKPSSKEVVSPKSNLGDKPFNQIVDSLVKAVFKANIYSSGWINSTEFFITKTTTHLMNSNGIDEEYVSYKGQIEVIPTWKKGKEEFELYKMIEFSNLDLDDITRQVKELLLQAKARANAKKMMIPEGTKVILSGDDNVKQVFEYFVEDLSYSTVFNKMNRCPVGTSVQGENITGTKLNLDLVPDVLNSTASAPIDMDGIVLKKVKLVKDGVAMTYAGNNQFAAYLGIKKPTGMIPNIVVGKGDKSIKEMKSEPYIECVKFSAFQMDGMSGFFGGEVRLGFYFDGKTLTPVTGFAISGNMHELKGSILYSKEVETLRGYKGPKALEIKGMKIA